MTRFLTILLPVRNAQATLAATVAEILETTAELTRHFELLIVDDGSTDATSEVAQELCQCYPQVRALRHGVSQGREVSVRTGLTLSKGEVVLVADTRQQSLAQAIRYGWYAATQMSKHTSAGGEKLLVDLALLPPEVLRTARRKDHERIDRQHTAAPHPVPAHPNFVVRLEELTVPPLVVPPTS